MKPNFVCIFNDLNKVQNAFVATQMAARAVMQIKVYVCPA